MNAPRVLAPSLLAVAALVIGCPDSSGPSFKEAVSEAYAPCKPDPVKVAAGLKATQLVFRPCGSNNFTHFDWNPRGTTLYYQSNMGPWVLKDTTEHLQLGIGIPRAGAAWVTDTILAYPDQDGRKIGIYDVESNIVNLVEINQHQPEQLEKGVEADAVVYLASEVPGGIQAVFVLRADTAESERAFPWMRGAVEEFTFHATENIVCYRGLDESHTTCADGETGKEIHRLEDRSRATLSPDGRYLVSEGEGPEVSVFADAAGPATSMALPGGASTVIRPPQLYILDRVTSEELLWEGVHGTDFDWYDPSPYFASYMLWGFDNVPMNRNVALVDLRHFLKAKGWSPPLAVDGSTRGGADAATTPTSERGASLR